MQLKLREWGPIILLALIPALPLLLGSGLVNTRAGGDSPFLLVRVHQLVDNLRAGIFPVRWMPQAAYGLGYPFFNFYASLPFYLAAIFKLAGLGYIASIKLTQALGFVLAALAIYGFSRELQPQKRVANLLVTLVYSCAPFHMVNVYVRGDSLSEFYAFVFFPLILWSLLRLHKKRSIRNAVWVALSYAGLLLTHNISAMIFTPFALLYALWLSWETKNVKSLLRGLVALGGGLLLSAWFWLPALAERGNVYLRDMTTGYFHYAQHFRSLDLVQPGLVFDYAITANQQPFRMGLLQAALALVGLTAILAWWIRQRRVESHSVFLVLLLASSTFMITPLSRPLWDRIPPLPLMQFPWRFLSLQALSTSLLVAYLIPQNWGKRIDTSYFVGPLVAFVLALLVLASALLGLRPERLVINEADVTTQRLMLYEYFTANVGTTIRTDYLPSGVEPRPYTSEVLWQEGTKPAPLTIAGEALATHLQAQGPTSEGWAIEVASLEALLAFHTYYYPGWEAHVDGHSAQIEPLPGLGYIGLRLPQGQHKVQLQLGRTRVQLIAEIISALAAGVVLVMLLFGSRRGQGFVMATLVASSTAETTEVVTTAQQNRLALGVMLLVGLALLVTGGQADTILGAAQKTRSPSTEQRLDLTMDFDRIPYLHHNPDGVLFGNVARLTHYELSSETIQAGEALTVITFWEGVERDDLTSSVAIVSPAQHLFGIPLAVAVDEQPLASSRTRHVLQVPETTMRGIYLLSVQVASPDGETRPVNSRGETLGITYLVPIRIDNQILASSGSSLLQQFGDRIALSKVEAAQRAAGALEVTLTWRVSASPPQNYKTALRLRDPTGWEVARLDTQPGYGFYPTSMWRPGELVNDRYVLAIDDGTPPGTEYSLDVTLYEAATLRPIGTASIPDVAITHPTVRQDYPILHPFGATLALSEAQLDKTELEQGEKLSLWLKWAAATDVDQDYGCRVALLDDAGTPVHHQTEPLVVGYPSSLWPQGAIINQYVELQLASDISVGQYCIALTVIEAGSGKEVGTFTLPDRVRIVEAARNFAIPQMQTSVGADFGGQIRLLGYDLKREENALRLTLHWQALSAMTTDYKIFVHLFDPKSEMIVSQQDIRAGGDGYPTTRWVAEEVVSDEVDLELEGVPDGTYRLTVGLYHAERRLPIAASPGFTVSADRLLLSETIQVP